MTNLLHDGASKVLAGITTIEEVFRVTRILKRDIDVIPERTEALPE